jgi:hypothetical protein
VKAYFIYKGVKMNDFNFATAQVLKFIRGMYIDEDLKKRLLISFDRIYDSPESLYQITKDIPRPPVLIPNIVRTINEDD